jgi:hypothetical protein
MRAHTDALLAFAIQCAADTVDTAHNSPHTDNAQLQDDELPDDKTKAEKFSS